MNPVGAKSELESSESWKRWEGQTAGTFPLQRYLGGSYRSAVFLTEAGGGAAAIKLIPANPASDEAQLARWKQAEALSHPHLLRILGSGRCRLGETRFLFVVIEFADENLSQLLPHRGLTPGEARIMLDPLLDALGYIHGKGLVHGRLKPANILAIKDQLKLSSESLVPAGPIPANLVEGGVYGPQEAASGKLTPASDAWGVGVTLIEGLTQKLPAARNGSFSVASQVPAPLDELVRGCCEPDPQKRWSLAQISEWLHPSIPRSAPVSEEIAPVERSTEAKPRNFVPITVGLAVVLIFGVWLLFRGHANRVSTAQPAAPPALQQTKIAPQPSTPPPAAAPLPAGNAKVPESAAPKAAAPADLTVAHRVLPEPPRSALRTVHGVIKVDVRTHIAPSGDVDAARLAATGTSKYFDRLALEAARQWKFAPGAGGNQVLRFEFSRHSVRGFPASGR